MQSILYTSKSSLVNFSRHDETSNNVLRWKAVHVHQEILMGSLNFNFPSAKNRRVTPFTRRDSPSVQPETFRREAVVFLQKDDLIYMWAYKNIARADGFVLEKNKTPFKAAFFSILSWNRLWPIRTHLPFSLPIRNDCETNRELDWWIGWCQVFVVNSDWFLALVNWAVIGQTWSG